MTRYKPAEIKQSESLKPPGCIGISESYGVVDKTEQIA